VNLGSEVIGRRLEPTVDEPRLYYFFICRAGVNADGNSKGVTRSTPARSET
jgi:hypothetical protein